MIIIIADFDHIMKNGQVRIYRNVDRIFPSRADLQEGTQVIVSDRFEDDMTWKATIASIEDNHVYLQLDEEIE